jgi:hypothetical protein
MSDFTAPITLPTTSKIILGGAANKEMILASIKFE